MVTITRWQVTRKLLPFWLSLLCLACGPHRVPSAQERVPSNSTYVVVSLASEQGEFERVCSICRSAINALFCEPPLNNWRTCEPP